MEWVMGQTFRSGASTKHMTQIQWILNKSLGSILACHVGTNHRKTSKAHGICKCSPGITLKYIVSLELITFSKKLLKSISTNYLQFLSRLKETRHN